MTTPEDAPRLEWVTPTEAAEMFGVSRQTLNVMVRRGEFASLAILGLSSKPQYVISRYEVEYLKVVRDFPRSKGIPDS